MTTRPDMTCDDVVMRLADYLEPDGSNPEEQRAIASHLQGCAACEALVSELRAISTQAAALPVRAPERDLWQGIAARIETPVVELPTRAVAVAPAPSVERGWKWSPRQAVLAASLLVAVTAGVTWRIASRAEDTNASLASSLGSAPASGAAADRSGTEEGAAPAIAVAGTRRPSADVVFDREIASLRRIVDQRRGELDPATVAILEKNLKLIDQAIAESKSALSRDPASGFLLDRLTHAYDTKLQLLRGVATLPARS